MDKFIYKLGHLVRRENLIRIYIYIAFEKKRGSGPTIVAKRKRKFDLYSHSATKPNKQVNNNNNRRRKKSEREREREINKPTTQDSVKNRTQLDQCELRVPRTNNNSCGISLKHVQPMANLQEEEEIERNREKEREELNQQNKRQYNATYRIVLCVSSMDLKVSFRSLSPFSFFKVETFQFSKYNFEFSRQNA